MDVWWSVSLFSHILPFSKMMVCSPSFPRVKSDHTAQKTVESSVSTLGMYVDALMDAIFSSVQNCPSLLRIALRQLWLRVAEMFRDPEFVVRRRGHRGCGYGGS